MRRRLLALAALLAPMGFSLSAQAAEVTVALGELPPYNMASGEAGIERDIVAEALANAGHSLDARLVPFGRIVTAFEGDADAATPMQTDQTDAHFSDRHIFYQNVVVSLDKADLTIASVADLRGKRVVCFAHCVDLLGGAFAEMAADHDAFREISDQRRQNELLFRGRADLSVGDFRIFDYYSKQIRQDGGDVPAYRFHRIFDRNHYRVAFKDASLRDDFNAGLAALRESGRYAQIVRRYTE